MSVNSPTVRWSSQDRQQFQNALTTLAEIMGRDLNQNLRTVYEEALSDYSPADAIRVARDFSRDWGERWMPRPAEFIERLKALGARSQVGGLGGFWGKEYGFNSYRDMKHEMDRRAGIEPQPENENAQSTMEERIIGGQQARWITIMATSEKLTKLPYPERMRKSLEMMEKAGAHPHIIRLQRAVVESL